ncbi:hypothetical protein TIFTF001_002282 [Ficus carica]|uniref:Uncharacterized protein n=1 Tax=Ficus carica TaxID=3494 RepID=A0AA87Z563_FICCA|nr:hypothetical protein TIFTF001_002282 [Ficus carica]
MASTAWGGRGRIHDGGIGPRWSASPYGSGKSRSAPVLSHLRRRRSPRESQPPPAPSTPLARLLSLAIETS